MQMTSNLSPVAARRIQSELKEWQNNPPEGFLLESCEPMTTWVILMQGPEGAAGGSHMYDGLLFRYVMAVTAMQVCRVGGLDLACQSMSRIWRHFAEAELC